MFIKKSKSLILAADLISIHFKISFPNTFTLLDGFNHPNFLIQGTHVDSTATQI